MDALYHKHLELRSDRRYFLYIGEMKAFGLNEYVRQGLSACLGRDMEPISIVSDVLEHYPPNTIVLNPEARRLVRESGLRTALRLPSAELARLASSEPTVLELVDTLLARQGELFVWMFESKPELTLTRDPRVKLLGPDPALSQCFNNKVWQYETFGPHVPMVDFRICLGREELRCVTDGLRETWCEGIFVSMEYSAAGMSSMVTRDCAEMLARFTDPEARYLASRYVPHDWDPTVLAVTANEDEVFVAGVADMRIEGGNMFRGSTFPSELPLAVQRDLVEHTRRVGQVLGGLGYRGIFGCDFIIDREGGPRFIEVNTRKQGTTMEYCCALEQNLPPGSANLLELEARAVLHGSFGGRMPMEPEIGQSRVHWGTYNNKTVAELSTGAELAQALPERELFARAAQGQAGHVILEHLGSRTRVLPGTFLGRVAAASPDRAGMLRELIDGMREIEESVEARAVPRPYFG